MTPKSVQVGALDLQMEKGNWGRVAGLVSGFTIYEPGAKIENRADHPGEFIKGRVMESRDWESRSLLRWWGRLSRSICEGTAPSMLDINNATYTPKTHNNAQTDQNRLVPRWDAQGDGLVGNWANVKETMITGAELAIGNDVATGETSSRINLKSLVAIANARKFVAVTVEDTTALTMVITTGITVVLPGGMNISEIGMFLRLRSHSPSEGIQTSRRQLVAYDFFGPPTNIPNGGVIAPRYTFSFAV
jgi:hypothetical protein